MRVIVSSHKCWLGTTMKVYSIYCYCCAYHQIFRECWRPFVNLMCVSHASDFNVCVAASIYCYRFVTFFSVGVWVLGLLLCFFGGGGCVFFCVCVFHTVKPHGRPDGWVCQNDLLHTKSCLRGTKLQENGAIVGHFNLWSEIELFTVFKHQTSQSMPCPRCVRSTNTEIT